MGLAVKESVSGAEELSLFSPPVTYSQGQSHTPLELAFTATGDTPGNTAGAAQSKEAQPSILLSWG